MKKYILVFMLFITAFAFSFDYTYQKMDSESTVALINNDEIISMDYLLSQTDSIKILDDLKNNYSDFFNILSTTEEGMNFLNKYYKTVLDKIIYKKLFVNYVESLGINISREELKTYYTEKISQIFEDSGMSDEDTNLYLYSQGYPNKETYIEANYFDSLYKNAINLLYNNQYDAITVSDEEIDSEYNQNKKLYVSDNKGLIKVIYFDKKEDSDYYYQKILNGELNYDDIYKTLEESQESSSLEVNLDTSEGQIVDLIKANFPG
ncbi:MAG TPA: SurA N-terminal domain-containing protein, partial [Tepiditoga sp.]|nr:SurA N-terminal domain-containing protein [Tepiditoga sp.]